MSSEASKQALKQLWSHPLSAQQLWASLHDNLLLQIINTQPTNVACILHRCVNKLAEIVFASKGPTAALKPLQAFANTYTNSAVNATPPVKGADDPVVADTIPLILNCVRLLTRLLSLLNENPKSKWMQDYLFGGPLPLPGTMANVQVEPAIARGVFGKHNLGEAIVLVMLDCLFLEGFSVHPSLATGVNRQSLRHQGVQLDKLWEIGESPNTSFSIVGPPNLPNIKQWILRSQGWSNHDSNRIEVLRALMTCFGEPIFLPPRGPSPPPANGSPTSSSSSSSTPAPPAFVPNRLLRFFVSEQSPAAQWTPTLFWSLMNLVANYHPEGQSTLTLPYNYSLYTDNREPLLEVSLQFLLMMLDFRHGEPIVYAHPHAANSGSSRSVSRKQSVESAAATPSSVSPASKTSEAKEDGSAEKAPEVSANTPSTSSAAPPTQAGDEQAPVVNRRPIPIVVFSLDDPISNVFHAIFTELSNPQCLTSFYSNMCRLLLNALMAESTYLPHSMKKLVCFPEILVLLWKMADENPYFVPHVLHAPLAHQNQMDILNLVTPLLYFVSEARKDESQLGLMYTCIFLLLKLSGDREFSVSLNRAVFSVPALAHIPLFALLNIVNITGGTYADLLIVIAHKLVVQSPNQLDALLKVLLTLLCNISPYLTKLSLFASVKLLNLFELFSSPKFVNANPTNYQYAAMLIDIFNNVIQYQYQGHANLVYSVIRRAKLFIELGRLELLPGQKMPVSVEEQNRLDALQRAATKRGSTDLNQKAKTYTAVSNTIEMAERASPPTPANASEPHTVAIVPSDMAPSAGTSPAGVAAVTEWTPTAEWANSWKRELPLEAIGRLLEFFEPKVEAIVGSANAIDESKLLEMISSTTLVGVLPVPHAIIVRKYSPNVHTNLWFSSYIYGLIFLRQQALSLLTFGPMSGAPIWRQQAVRMFMIASAQANYSQQQQQLLQQQQQQQQQAAPIVQPDQANASNTAAAPVPAPAPAAASEPAPQPDVQPPAQPAATTTVAPTDGEQVTSTPTTNPFAASSSSAPAETSPEASSSAPEEPAAAPAEEPSIAGVPRI